MYSCLMQCHVHTICIQSVWKSYFNHLKPLAFTTSDAESKYFVAFKDPFSDCNVVTIGKHCSHRIRCVSSMLSLNTRYCLGVGGSVSAERHLFRRYPQCDWLAVDPDAEVNERIVKSVPRAQFLKATVGGKTEKRVASIRKSRQRFMALEIS